MPSVLGTLLAHIPWGQVVESAPKIAQGAGRLWESVKNRRSPPAAETAPSGDAAPSPLQQLADQVQALEASVQDLQDQMQASAALSKQLAEQNALLVERMDRLQRQQRWQVAVLAGVSGAALLLAAAGWMRA